MSLKSRSAVTKVGITELGWKPSGYDGEPFKFNIPKGSTFVRMEDGRTVGSFHLEEFTPEMKADPELIWQLETVGYVVKPEALIIDRPRQPQPLIMLLNYVPDHLKDPQRIRHLNAVQYPTPAEKGFLTMLRGWLQYADVYKRETIEAMSEEEFPEMSFDHYTGPHWAQIGWRLNSMLSSPLGDRLDMGTLSSIINKALKQEGYNIDDL